MSIPNIPPNVQTYITILEEKQRVLEEKLIALSKQRVTREYRVGKWRQHWLGNISEESPIPMFIVTDGVEFLPLKSARVADAVQATLNLMDVEDAESQVQTPVNDSSAEGASPS